MENVFLPLFGKNFFWTFYFQENVYLPPLPTPLTNIFWKNRGGQTFEFTAPKDISVGMSLIVHFGGFWFYGLTEE
jgi:hypothetical protein